MLLHLKIGESLRYLSNFWRSLEMPLINCEVEVGLSLKWIEDCVFATAAYASNATLKVTYTKLYVLVVTLLTEGNAKWTKKLSEGFKGPVY